MTRFALALALSSLVGCHRSSETPSDASTASSAPASASAPAPSALAPAPTAAPAHTQAPAGEARRALVPNLDREPDLAPFHDRFRDHFGDPTSGPFRVQRVDLAWGRKGILAARTDESEPIILVVDGTRVVFAKDHPTGGISPAPRSLAIVAHPAGGIAFVAFVPTLNVVAMRVWADDGNPFADMQLFAIEACDALTAKYAPGDGWRVLASRKNGQSREQWIRDDGTLAFGPFGAPH